VTTPETTPVTDDAGDNVMEMNTYLIYLPFLQI
jgi:hypothetical protein